MLWGFHVPTLSAMRTFLLSYFHHFSSIKHDSSYTRITQLFLKYVARIVSPGLFIMKALQLSPRWTFCPGVSSFVDSDLQMSNEQKLAYGISYSWQKHSWKQCCAHLVPTCLTMDLIVSQISVNMLSASKRNGRS